MKIRFKGDYLEDERGERVEVSYDELLRGCLATSFETISISKIIFKGVYEVTKFKVMRTRDYARTELFRMLEEDIQKSASYQRAKAEKMIHSAQIREAQRKESQTSMIVDINYTKWKYARKKHMAKLRPYKNYRRGSH